MHNLSLNDITMILRFSITKLLFSINDISYKNSYIK